MKCGVAITGTAKWANGGGWCGVCGVWVCSTAAIDAVEAVDAVDEWSNPVTEYRGYRA